jgi:hypothetical protein
MTLAATIDRLLPADETVILDQDLLDRVMQQVMGENNARPQAIFYTAAVRQQLAVQSPELQARSGGWTFHVSRGAVQSVLTGLVMAIVFKDVAASSLALAIIPTVLPCLFQIERTQLTRKDEEVLLQLYRVAATKGKTSEELLAQLPATIREHVNRLDLLEFLEAVTKTGHATEVSPGVFQLRHPDNPRFVVSFT